MRRAHWNLPRVGFARPAHAPQEQPGVSGSLPGAPPALPLTIVALTAGINPRDLALLRHFSITDVLENPLTAEKVRGFVRRYFPQALAAPG